MREGSCQHLLPRFAEVDEGGHRLLDLTAIIHTTSRPHDSDGARGGGERACDGTAEHYPQGASGMYHIAATALFALVATASARDCTQKVLVAMSSADALPIKLTNGTMTTVPIGFYLDELMFPLMALLESGWQPTFANPQGNRCSEGGERRGKRG